MYKIWGMNSIHERIKDARIKKGLSMKALGELLGVNWQTIQQWENGSTAPKRTRLTKVAEFFGITEQFLLNGEEQGDHVQVALIDIKASAGKGKIVFSEDESKGLMFRRDYLERVAGKNSKVAAFHVEGESMIDRHIPDGSVVLFNTSVTDKKKGKVYIFRIDGEIYIKELVKVNEEWYARSYNNSKKDKYPDIKLGDADTILGQVFWCGFSL